MIKEPDPPQRPPRPTGGACRWQIGAFQNPQHGLTKADFHPKVLEWCCEQELGSEPPERISSKVILIGEPNVGKTTLIYRYTNGVFKEKLKPTIGVDFSNVYCDILHIPTRLLIWDTAGLEKYRAITQVYVNDSHVAVVAFDLSRPETFDAVEGWVGFCRNARVAKNCFVIILGLKKDLKEAGNERLSIRGQELADRVSAEYWEVSAKDGTEVGKLMNRIAVVSFQSQVLERLEQAALIAANPVKSKAGPNYPRSNWLRCSIL